MLHKYSRHMALVTEAWSVPGEVTGFRYASHSIYNKQMIYDTVFILGYYFRKYIENLRCSYLSIRSVEHRLNNKIIKNQTLKYDSHWFFSLKTISINNKSESLIPLCLKALLKIKTKPSWLLLLLHLRAKMKLPSFEYCSLLAMRPLYRISWFYL